MKWNVLPAVLVASLSFLSACHPDKPAGIVTRSVASVPVTMPATIPIAAQPIETADPTEGPGPTVKSRVPDGYQLLNRQFRVVISDKTGNVIFWGFADQPRNMLAHRGIYTTLSALADAPIKGYVEARDEQTWQFIGEDENHIGWRKIYNLEGDHLEYSILIQNNRSDALDTAVNLNGEIPAVQIIDHDPEQFNAFGNTNIISLRGYNETHDHGRQPNLPILLQSDLFHLKPQERQSYTTLWILSK